MRARRRPLGSASDGTSHDQFAPRGVGAARGTRLAGRLRLGRLLTPPAADVVGVAVSIPWETAGVAGVLAGLISYLGSVASAPVGDTISPASTVRK